MRARRALGIDLGSKRIGIAVGDRSGSIATPLLVLQRSGDRRLDHRRIADLVVEEEADVVVVGLPLNMNGTSGPAANAAVAETRALATVLDVPVETYDERRTTTTADAVLMEAKVRAPERRKVVDKIAAAVMLQSWLDAGGAHRHVDGAS